MSALPVIVPDWRPGGALRACVTTRAGGVSAGTYGTLNLGDHVGDAPAAVAENRRRLVAGLGLPAEPHWLRQVHGAAVAADGAGPDPVADAAVTGVRGRVCAVMIADCLPVFLADTAGRQAGVAHAGWRGLAAGVLEATIAAFRVPAAQLTAWLGPAIGPAAFEVGPEVRAAFVAGDPAAAADFRPGVPGRWQADLAGLARRRLAAAGVAQVQGGGLCTWSDRERFFSYRRDGQTGRMAALIWMDP